MSISVPQNPHDPAQQPGSTIFPHSSDDEDHHDDKTQTQTQTLTTKEKEKEKEKSHRYRLKQKMENLKNDFSRLKTAVATTYNPNHRHDEEHEKAIDAKLEAIRDAHRFRSFAPPREGNIVKPHIDGHDYFYALSLLIEDAQSTIFILDWWLTPELYLRRPPALHGEKWRLDNTLKRAAERGVKVYVMVYKEVTASMSLNSKHTKHALEDLHDNIACMRHPDHSGGELVYYWSHHEKLCLVDNKVAAMGGLDACFGRWDTHAHPLADVHPTDWAATLFPGQDYNNSRVMDFQAVDRFTSNLLAIQDTPRMPWHDVSLTIIGPSVVDLSQHFIERWNFVKEFKYKHDHKFDWLALPAPFDDIRVEEERDAETVRRRDERQREHPHLARWAEMGRQFAHPYHWPPSDSPRASEPVPVGQASVQVLRSSSDWSHGILTEDSIQQAYITMIREAVHTIYIENQFFITTCDDNAPVTNQIGLALAERIISAAKDGTELRIIIIIPAVPAFAGDIQSQAGLKAIMEAQYKSISRGSSSIYETVRQAGYSPESYISFWNLRSYDRINSPKAITDAMEKNSGITFHQAQAALAKIMTGNIDTPDLQTVVLERPKDETGDPNQKGKKQTVNAGVSVPKTVEEAWDIIRRFQQGAPRSDANVSDNVCQHAFQDGTSLLEEQWNGSPPEELDDYVSELCYIHSKLMIVDDRRIICGSANLNDRSQRGDRDSEIAIIIEDGEMIEMQMGGQTYMASKLATSWRRMLMREHLGLMSPQQSLGPTSEPSAAMLPVPHPGAYDHGSDCDKMVEDVLSPAFWKIWSRTAMNNRAAFEKVFRPVPNNQIRNWKQYDAYLAPSKGVLYGHVADQSLSLQDVKEFLNRIQGHLVDMPLDFLSEVDMTSGAFASVNSVTLPVYL